MHTFITDLELKDIVMSGYSMGGGTALHYTLDHPKNVDKLILFSSSGLSFIPAKSGMIKIKKLAM